MSYKIRTNKSWHQTNTDLSTEFKMWGISDWDTNYPKGAMRDGFNQTTEERSVTLRYNKNGKEVILKMDTQNRAADNLRVLFLAIQSMRLNEKRGIGEVLESAYLQLSAPAGERDPYEVLGVLRGMDLKVYEAVYRTLSTKYHPDSKPDGSEAKFKEITSAIERIRKELL